MPMIDTVDQRYKHSILVVDDDEAICDLLRAALSSRFIVTTHTSGVEAMKEIEEKSFDLIITDLMLPDVSGIDILACAKERDEFAEVLMITGSASVDSATAAINGGVSSYMLKPFSIRELRGRVEKMIAARMFHLKSVQLMNRSDLVDPTVKGHIDDVTTLYHFTRKLMLTLEISEVMRIILEEANQKIGAEFCSLEIDILAYREIYSMATTGLIGREFIDGIFADNWENAFSCIDLESFKRGDVPHYIYKGRQGEFVPAYDCKPMGFPLVVTGKTIGSLIVWVKPDRVIEDRLDQYLHILTSITSPVIEHVYADQQARFQAKTDGLTGISNHRHFYEALEREIARANRKKSRFALVLADIDNFKAVNDTHGHQIGDAVLVNLTKHLNANIRTCDIVARYGGEEFAVILPDSDVDGAIVLANRIRESIAGTPYVGSKCKISYTASFGLAMYDGNSPINKDELVFMADTALYRSKSNGKNRVTLGEMSEGSTCMCREV